MKSHDVRQQYQLLCSRKQGRNVMDGVPSSPSSPPSSAARWTSGDALHPLLSPRML
eukprot:CAMPEP_0119397456 /NCGR_PEP_ID=MMETSP1334-20130426/140345_1 /TAXON_ID=127549 /ORGANISM="Calcidiscus leptoporus, Strain RCC1130" /LENGTH=55 /DNA_ID=CAMNT_0007421299 /DNA_START=1120 /DNA_END=1287 /DNA_ORIENTATION=-